MSLKSSFILSGTLQFSLSIFTAIFGLFQIHYLGTSLTTIQLGILAIVMFLSTICQNISEAGLGAYILHREKITKEVIDGSSITAVVIGLLVAFLSILVGFVLYKIYGSYEIIISGWIISFGFLISSLSAVYQALLLKLNRINFVSISDFLSKNTSVLLSIFLIDKGVGVVAIPISLLFGIVFRFVIYLVGLMRDDIMLIPKSLPRENIKNVICFSMAQLSSQIVNSVTAKLDELIIGKFISLQALGIYSLFKSLVIQAAGLILPIARRLFMPVLSNSKTNQQKIESIIVLSHDVFTVFTALYFGFAFIFSRELTEFLFDRGVWASYNLLSILAVTWFFRISGGCLQTACVQIYGKPWIEFKWNLIQGLMIIFVVSFFSALGFQLDIVLYSILCVYIFSFLLSFKFFYLDLFGDAIIKHITKVIVLGALKVAGLLVLLQFLHHQIEYYKWNVFYWAPFYSLCALVLLMFHFRAVFKRNG